MCIIENWWRSSYKSSSSREFDGAVQAVVSQPLVPQKCRLQMSEWIRSCWVGLSFGGRFWCVWVLWWPGQDLESHLRGVIAGLRRWRDDSEWKSAMRWEWWRGQCSRRCSGVSGCVGHQGQWGSSVMPILCRWEFRRLCPIRSLVTTVSRARLGE